MIDELLRRQRARATAPIGPIVITINAHGSTLLYRGGPELETVAGRNLFELGEPWSQLAARARVAIAETRPLDFRFVIRDGAGIPRPLRAEVAPQREGRADIVIREERAPIADADHPLYQLAVRALSRF